VLLGSIYVRDALIDSDERTAQAARDQIRALQADVARELQQYEATVDSPVEPADWKRLEEEVRDYWNTAVRLAARGSDEGIASAQSVLRTQVIPKRDAIVHLSDEIRQFIADAVGREQRALADLNAQVRRRLWLTTAAAVGLGIAAALLATWYVGRLEARIQEDHAEVVRNKQQLQRLSGRLTRAQEDERRTIARELHDEIGQALTAVDVELAGAERSVRTDGPAAAALAEARSVTQRALAGVRDLSQLLRPSMLDDFGLPDTLKWYLRKFSDRTGIRTELIGNQLTNRLPIDLEVCAYRTVQEALTNVSRHAQASACRVFVQRLSSSLVVTVEDDGRGLESERDGGDARREGLGLIGIRERVVELGGTFRIEGKAGKGTRLTIELPLSTEART
jgi:signal transduction histidine kinase